MKLTDIGIKKIKPREKTFKLFDGGGLYIQIGSQAEQGILLPALCCPDNGVFANETD